MLQGQESSAEPPQGGIGRETDLELACLVSPRLLQRSRKRRLEIVACDATGPPRCLDARPTAIIGSVIENRLGVAPMRAQGLVETSSGPVRLPTRPEHHAGQHRNEASADRVERPHRGDRPGAMSRFGDLEEDHHQRRQAGHVGAVAHLANREAEDRERHHQRSTVIIVVCGKNASAPPSRAPSTVPPIRSSARCQVAAK